uniref:BACK domain-containing protein n=1 Tax=Terrapene triunguis TaxID=2587831 RepID=A0A674K6V9_9SAUR
MSKGESSEHHIVIRGVDAETFQALLEFTRTAKVLITLHNVTHLLETADFLQFERVKRMCEKFLERELHVSNCLSLMAYAQCFACPELHASALSVALTHWTEVTSQEEFKKLPKEMLLQLLQNNDLFVPREDVVFDTNSLQQIVQVAPSKNWANSEEVRVWSLDCRGLRFSPH